jgi:hypothetical protein
MALNSRISLLNLTMQWLNSFPDVNRFTFPAGGPNMRYTIDTDEKLLAEAMKLMGTRTKRETVRKAIEAEVARYQFWNKQMSAHKAERKNNPLE